MSQPCNRVEGGNPSASRVWKGDELNRLEDRFGRRFKYLRLSLTEACNFRCVYCLPNGYRASWTSFLTPLEFERAARAFYELGVSKIRYTGGEPTLRKDFFEIARRLRSVGFEEIALSTNGWRLRKDARAYRNVGIQSLNISLDGADPESFFRVTGKENFSEILSGIELALCEDFRSIKINVVRMKRLNGDSLSKFMEWVKEWPITIRFIELMKTGDNQALFEKHHVRNQDWIDQLESNGWLRRVRGATSGPAVEFTHPEYKGGIGFISPYADHFCDSCNRLRVSARGELKLCLFGNDRKSLRDLLVSDEQIEDLKSRIITLLGLKESSHALHEGEYGETRNFASIGG